MRRFCAQTCYLSMFAREKKKDLPAKCDYYILKCQISKGVNQSVTKRLAPLAQQHANQFGFLLHISGVR
jgi:hypothetical protein